VYKGWRTTLIPESRLPRKPRDGKFVPIKGSLDRNGEILSLGNEYFVSLGAHYRHVRMIMDRKGAVEPLSLEKAFALCALLTYAIDAPVVPAPSPGHDLANQKLHRRGLRYVIPDGIEGYLEVLGNAAEENESLFELRGQRAWHVHRKPLFPGPLHRQPYLELPKNDQTWRLLMVYWGALLAISPQSRLLNFWRVFEAATPKNSRVGILRDLAAARPKPVWSQQELIFRPGVSRVRVVNGVRVLRRFALKRWSELLKTHGTPKAAADHLYWTRRGKSAHADTSAAEFDQLGDLSGQVRDAELLRYAARIALERAWA
jgi:hypothetical protein